MTPGERRTTQTGASPEEILAELERALASKAFVRSARISRFLRFVVEQALQGKAGELKEYAIGVEVFDRKSSYDPRVDPIVRVEARRLRATLRKYYEAEGHDDPVVIELPKGSYAPVFRPRLQPAPSAQPAPESTTVAVLPFANLSADPENEYFSDGLTEEIINALTKAEGLRVVSRTSSFQFKGKAQDIRRIGEQLGAGAVLEGSVRKAGETLRITAQLINAADGCHLWSETYQRESKDVFAIQEDISRAIVGALRIQLAAGPEWPLVRRQTHCVEAYHCYLKGRYFLNKRTEENLNKGIECFEQAIECDRSYAAAYAGLADAYTLIASYSYVPPRDVMPKARAAALKAMELDDALAEAHVSLGFYSSICEWDWTRAEQYYTRAIQLNPKHAGAHHWYAMDHLAATGRLEQARKEIELALMLDPLAVAINTTSAWLYYLARDYERAMEQYRQALELDPAFYRAYIGLGRSCAYAGCLDEAIEALEKALAISEDNRSALAVLAECEALRGNGTAAEERLASLMKLSEQKYVSPFDVAVVHMALGHTERAFEWLEKAYEEREGPLIWLGIHPSLDPLRSDPRFAALLRRMKLDQFIAPGPP